MPYDGLGETKVRFAHRETEHRRRPYPVVRDRPGVAHGPAAAKVGKRGVHLIPGRKPRRELLCMHWITPYGDISQFGGKYVWISVSETFLY